MTKKKAKALAQMLVKEGHDFFTITNAISVAQNYEGLSDDTIDEIVSSALNSL